MKLLLINKNPVVSRMMHMSVPKAGFELEECDNVYNLPIGTYEVIILDDEMYDENFLQNIKQNVQYKKIGLITLSKDEEFSEFDFVLHKPFLPTDLIEILRKMKTEIEESVEESTEDQVDLIIPQQEKELTNFTPNDIEEKEESIVEIEEVEEESPFVTEPLEKAGVLKDEEIEQVSSLLDENDDKGDEESNEKKDQGQKDSIESSLLVQEPSSAQDILTEVSDENQELVEEQEQEDETNLEMVDENTQDNEDTLPLKQEVNEERIHPSDSIQSTEKIESLKNQIERLDVPGLRGILDGMKLEITIKISYPDRDDV